jgi:hypothetical protein
MFRMLAVFADFECSMIRERVTAGLSRAKADGIQLGQLEDTNVEGGGDRRGACQRDRDPNCSRVPGGHGPVGFGATYIRCFDVLHWRSAEMAGARRTAASGEQYLVATDVAVSHPAEKLI